MNITNADTYCMFFFKVKRSQKHREAQICEIGKVDSLKVKELSSVAILSFLPFPLCFLSEFTVQKS